jgi:hypothetical protein
VVRRGGAGQGGEVTVAQPRPRVVGGQGGQRVLVAPPQPRAVVGREGGRRAELDDIARKKTPDHELATGCALGCPFLYAASGPIIATSNDASDANELLARWQGMAAPCTPPRFESNLWRRACLPKGGKKDPRLVGGVGIKSQF